MTIVRIKGIKRFRDRHGKWRCYHRKTGLPIKAQFGSGDFFEELARLDGLARQTAEPRSGTLGMLLTQYRASSEFKSLAPRTRTDYQRVLDYLKPIADTPLDEVRSWPGCTHTRQSERARATIRKLCKGRPLDIVFMGYRARIPRYEPRGARQEYQASERRARSQQTLDRC